jgi:alpha-galactosidase/6-phospho-beta-glucosidase family protein
MAVAKKPAIRRKSPLKIRRSVEYGSSIIHSLETGEPRVVYGNVENTGLITNLPAGCCVEVPCMVDKNGIQPTQIGANPCPSCGLDADEHQCSSSDD